MRCSLSEDAQSTRIVFLKKNTTQDSCANPAASWGLFGTPGRTRTCDLRIRSPALYPTELRAQAFFRQCQISDLNQLDFRNQSRPGSAGNVQKADTPFADLIVDWSLWGERWGLNPRPQGPQPCALPTELRSPHGSTL
jgi:hypothetical protein